MKVLLTLFTVLLLGLSSTQLDGQTDTSRYTDIIYLENGSVFKSRILEYQQGGDIKVEIKGGHVLVFPEEDVARIIQSDDGSLPGIKPPRKKRDPLPKPKDYSVRGWYHDAWLGASAREEEWGGFELNPNLSYTVGYQFNKYIGVGLTTGLDSYQNFRAERVIPLFADFRMYPLKNNAIYLGLQGGYGFALPNQLDLVTEASGGWGLMPHTGIRLQISKSFFLAGGIGYRIQNANYTYENFFFPDGGFGTARRDYQFQRIVVHFGIQFQTPKEQ